MFIREAQIQDFDSIWPIFHEIVASGESYAFNRDISHQEARKIWMESPQKTFLIEENGTILGSYFIKANQQGGGSHVCNCGYMVSSIARGRGLATLMCEHSQNIARELGYKAMQFNFVIETNVGAVKLWHKLGFETIGILPRAFNHPKQGYVGVHVMYKWLEKA
ncbi:GNAT family N-acetyltransferase [Marinicella sp. W31]|uniref:GNAT family N-acetyltransferase n=1 Tax=Marinicella sp. W31 TaxID=3023713 RepID=UPI0037568E6F